MNLFSPAEIAANYSTAGASKAKMPFGKLFVLAILAGMLIGFPSAVTNMSSYALENNSVIRVLSGVLFAFGLGMVVLTGAELFTGNTLISISVLDRKATVVGMLRNWIIVFIGNFIGSLIVAFICARFGWLSAGKDALAAYTMKVATGKMNMPFQNAFMMGILCNVLVTLGVLLSLGGKDGVSRFLGAWAPVMFFVVCGFNHSIADMTYCTMGLFAKSNAAYCEAATALGVDLTKLTWGNYFGGNMLPVTLGNIVGGVAIGAIFWFCWIRKPKEAK
ncbi:MAG: formate/nitrite transporter family protein [Oscillospiraceae bacterium]|nr:formate/nitrite transporter family protein [Oscillospiraceae bacterium]